MVTRRIIPCLDIRDGRVVKGVRFEHLRDAGDPVERAVHYRDTGADELCFLDVAASVESRGLCTDLVEAIAAALNIPFTVGGGIRSVDEARKILRAGADKVAVNTAALHQPALLAQLAEEFGRQCVVVSIDTRRANGTWRVTTHGGRQTMGKTCEAWAQEAVERGAGEILLNVIDTDGTREGFALEITQRIAESVTVPVIGSGGGGRPKHFIDVFTKTGASAALAASIFHDRSWTPNELKHVLLRAGIEVRV